MKNVFKFFGIALVASAMLTACNGDKYTITAVPNDSAMGTVTGGGEYEADATATLTATPNSGYVFVNWNDGNTDNPRTITVTADATYTANFEAAEGVSVTLGTTTWTAGVYQCADYSAYGMFVAVAYEDAQASQLPRFDAAVVDATGTHTDSYSDNGWANGNASYIEYYEEYSLSDGTNSYGDWWAKDASINVTTMDLTAGKVSATISGTMFWALQAFVNDYGATGIDGADTRAYSATLSNCAITSGGKNPIMKGLQIL